MKSIKRKIFAFSLVILVVAGTVLPFQPAHSMSVEEAVDIARDTYIYGYPLVTFDMARRQQTNVAAPDAEHAPMGQMIKMRSYPKLIRTIWVLSWR